MTLIHMTLNYLYNRSLTHCSLWWPLQTAHSHMRVNPLLSYSNNSPYISLFSTTTAWFRAPCFVVPPPITVSFWIHACIIIIIHCFLLTTGCFWGPTRLFSWSQQFLLSFTKPMNIFFKGKYYPVFNFQNKQNIYKTSVLKIAESAEYSFRVLVFNPSSDPSSE